MFASLIGATINKKDIQLLPFRRCWETSKVAPFGVFLCPTTLVVLVEFNHDGSDTNREGYCGNTNKIPTMALGTE